MAKQDPLAALHRRIYPGCRISSGCGSGWNALLVELDAKLAKLDPQYKIGQYKEKYGTLRFYADASEGLGDAAHDEFYRLIEEAQRASAKICEVCGKPGELRGNGWWYTACDECNEKRRHGGVRQT